MILMRKTCMNRRNLEVVEEDLFVRVSLNFRLGLLSFDLFEQVHPWIMKRCAPRCLNHGFLECPSTRKKASSPIELIIYSKFFVLFDLLVMKDFGDEPVFMLAPSLYYC